MDVYIQAKLLVIPGNLRLRESTLNAILYEYQDAGHEIFNVTWLNENTVQILVRYHEDKVKE